MEGVVKGWRWLMRQSPTAGSSKYNDGDDGGVSSERVVNGDVGGDGDGDGWMGEDEWTSVLFDGWMGVFDLVNQIPLVLRRRVCWVGGCRSSLVVGGVVDLDPGEPGTYIYLWGKRRNKKDHTRIFPWATSGAVACNHLHPASQVRACRSSTIAATNIAKYKLLNPTFKKTTMTNKKGTTCPPGEMLTANPSASPIIKSSDPLTSFELLYRLIRVSGLSSNSVYFPIFGPSVLPLFNQVFPTAVYSSPGKAGRTLLPRFAL